MKLLLDTHALLWWLAGEKRLGPTARGWIADPGNDILVSVVSLWEIVVKTRIGKLTADIGRIEQAVMQDGFQRLGITRDHLATLAGLELHHRDPFDHLLMAQALTEAAIFVSDDQRAALYLPNVLRCSA